MSEKPIPEENQRAVEAYKQMIQVIVDTENANLCNVFSKASIEIFEAANVRRLGLKNENPE